MAATLTDEDRRLLALLADGASIHVLARELAVSERTVRNRITSLRERFGVNTTIEAVVSAVRAGEI